MTASSTNLSRPGVAGVERARVGVAVAFAVNGLTFASWLARLPAIRDELGLDNGQLGLLLLCMSGGAVAALPLSGVLVHRFGPGATVLGGGGTVAVGLLLVSVGVWTGSVPAAAPGLVLAGLGTGVWDVAMNVEAADVEQRLGRTIMPRFHAGFSLGTVAGALLGAAGAALGVPVAIQLAVMAGVAVVVLGWSVRSFLPVAPTPAGQRSGTGRAWREPRTLSVGLLVLAFALVEGTANEWLAIALVDGHGASEATGAVGYGAFVAAMTLSRLLGGGLLERYGRPLVLRASAGLATVGLLLVVTGGAVPLVFLGALLWGLGAALGFPVGMSSGADEPARAAARVSVISSIGYTGFLAGPPLIGSLAEAVGILRALLVVLVALAVGVLTSGSTRPPLPEAPVHR